MAAASRWSCSRPRRRRSRSLATRPWVASDVVLSTMLLALLVPLLDQSTFVSATSPQELRALAELYNACNGDEWVRHEGWLDGDPCATPIPWFGVSCSNISNVPHVTAIMLPNNGLVGSLQPSIGYLTALRILDLSANNLTSSLPSSLSTIPFLSTLNVSNNQMSGDLGLFFDTFDIIVSGEYGLFPQSRGANLRHLALGHNDFSGTLSPNLYLLPLESLDLGSNRLDGLVPEEILRIVYPTELSGNQFKCPLPLCIGGNPHVRCTPPCCVTVVPPGPPPPPQSTDIASLPTVITLSALVGAMLVIVFEVVLMIIIVRCRRRERYHQALAGLDMGLYDFHLGDILLDKNITRISQSDVGIIKRIGIGVGGEVMSGEWRVPGGAPCSVAVKRVELTGLGIDTNRQTAELLREMKFLSALDHPNIVRFLGIIYEEGDMEIGLVTELMDNGSLAELLRKGPIEWRVKLQLALDAAEGMLYLHSREPPVIHRDLKTSNLLVNASFTCKIADFGISTIKKSTRTMTSIGTPIYMAPEVIKHTRYSEKADVYSFGIVLCEIFTQQTPYADEPFREMTTDKLVLAVATQGLRPVIPDNCPTDYQRLITDCLNEDPEQRPGFEEIVERLRVIHP